MLTLNDLQRLELYARQVGMNYPGMVYRIGMRFMRQDNIGLAFKAFSYVVADFTSSGRVNIEAHCRLADISRINGNYSIAYYHLADALDGFRWIANHSE